MTATSTAHNLQNNESHLREKKNWNICKKMPVQKVLCGASRSRFYQLCFFPSSPATHFQQAAHVFFRFLQVQAIHTETFNNGGGALAAGALSFWFMPTPPPFIFYGVCENRLQKQNKAEPQNNGITQCKLPTRFLSSDYGSSGTDISSLYKVNVTREIVHGRERRGKSSQSGQTRQTQSKMNQRKKKKLRKIQIERTIKGIESKDAEHLKR